MMARIALFFGIISILVDFRKRIIMDRLWRCIEHNLELRSVQNHTTYLYLTNLRCQSVCIEFKGCCIPVTFWSSSGLIVFEKFQGGMMTLHTLDLNEVQFPRKKDREETKRDEEAALFFSVQPTMESHGMLQERGGHILISNHRHAALYRDIQLNEAKDTD